LKLQISLQCLLVTFWWYPPVSELMGFQSTSNLNGLRFLRAWRASSCTAYRYINLSLHYLEQVIVALGERSRTHIPYVTSSAVWETSRISFGENQVLLFFVFRT
jgi:hypothetical protein